MSDASRFPVNLLTQPKANRLAYFRKYTVAHPILKRVDERLRKAIEESGGAGLIFVYGPTGVGKSTLMDRVASRLSAENPPEAGTKTLPVLKLEAPAPEQGNFHWGQLYRQALIELEAPFLKDKMEYSDSPVYFDRAGNLIIGRRLPVQELRDALEKALRYRRPKAFIIDEAQHLAKMSSGRKLLDQMDALKSLANQSRTLLVLIGTYELLNFHQLSGQLSRRSAGLHFPRYGSGSGDLKAFQSILYGFQQQMPVEKEPDLLRNWESIYLRSVGCVGILKDWLVRALNESFDNGERTVTQRTIDACALSVAQCEQIAAEMIAGEERLREKPGGNTQRLSQMLGLAQAVKDAKTILGPPAIKKSEEAVEQKPRQKRRVGERKPKRNDVPSKET